jgi:superfamily I DNA/RNA helicase
MELIKRYGGGLNERLQQLRKQVVSADNREKADLILSTVHRAKGLEYDRVKLLPDFITEKKLRKMLEEKKKVVRPDKLIEEINLLYVALTRSRGQLLVPDDWFEPEVKGTEKYIVTKKEEVMVHEGEIPYCSTPSSVGNLYVGKRVTRKPTEIRKTRTSNHSSNFFTRKSSKKKNMRRE